MTYKSNVFRKLIAGVMGLGVVAILSACGQSQDTATAPPADTTAPAATESPAVSTSPDATTAEGESDETVAEVVDDNDSFDTLEEAIDAAGLEETLAEAGPYTIFAPTDEAFEALPAETREALLQPENQEKLKQILSYHVVPGSIASADITPGEVTTAAGTPVAIATDAGQVTVGGATVVQPDIQASNGVVHAIDQVLIPPGFEM